MVIHNNYLSNINKSVNNNQTAPAIKKPVSTPSDFQRIFQEKLEDSSGLKFSKHAELRLQTRNIQLSQMQKEKILEAVNKAEKKGVKDSLVLLDNIAFVVNVKNRTVITAVNSNELKENVFTNIDGAVFA